jgi:hypothetical protein
MEALTRLVSESLARHGFNRPLDYRRLHWSRWFRCESHHSLLLVPSKPGVFALAEEVVSPEYNPGSNVEERGFSTASSPIQGTAAFAAEQNVPVRRMLAVTQFFEDDDMAFVLDRMLARQNPMRSRLNSGHYFVRFVVIEDQFQRRSICNALNQWIANSAEKASGIGAHFATSLELADDTHVAPSCPGHGSLQRESKDPSPASAASTVVPRMDQELSPERRINQPPVTTPQLDSGAAANMHCPSPFPSGF